MLIREFQDSVDTQKLAALSQFLLARADDTGAKKTISVEAFLNLANNQGISLTREGLIQLSQRPPLSNLIQTVEGDRIVFQGAEGEQVTDTMTVDQARKTVDTMAKRAAKKGL
jgi:hypothetical protein